MKRRDLAWVTNDQGDVVAVAVAHVDEVAQRVDVPDARLAKGETLHVAGVSWLAPVG